MVRRRLGNTGIEVSEIAFGGVEIGVPYGIGVKDRSDMLSHDEAIYLLHAALDGGINFFDTARLYGDSEMLMGKALKDRRNKAVIATKCKHLKQAGEPLPSYSQLKQIIESSVEESLAALQTDYLDVFMLHQADKDIIHNDEIRAIFETLRQRGLIRATGLSTYTVEETKLAIDSKAWNVIQIPFNLMDQRQAALFPLAVSQGVGLVVRSVLLKGLLSSRGRDLHPALHQVEAHIQKYKALLDSSTQHISTVATKFALSFDEVSSVLVGIDRMTYLKESLKNADGKYLNAEELQRAKNLAYPNPEFIDLHRWHQEGWLL